MVVNCAQPCVAFTSSRAQPCVAEESSRAQPYTHGYNHVSAPAGLRPRPSLRCFERPPPRDRCRIPRWPRGVTPAGVCPPPPPLRSQQQLPPRSPPPPPPHAQVGAGVGKPPHGLGGCMWMPLVNGTGNSPVSGTADPRSSQTGQVIRGLH